MHVFSIKILSLVKVKTIILTMNTTSCDLESHLRAGRVYRRDELLPFSKSLDRDLSLLTTKGALEKLGAGLYYKPAKSYWKSRISCS